MASTPPFPRPIVPPTETVLATPTTTTPDVETVLRLCCFCCFFGHGWIAALNLEFNSWVKFAHAGGFRTSEAKIVLPLIGWMDMILAVLIVVRPFEILTAWMVGKHWQNLFFPCQMSCSQWNIFSGTTIFIHAVLTVGRPVEILITSDGCQE